MSNKILVCGLDIYESRDRRGLGKVVEVVGIDCKRNKIIIRDVKTRRTTYVRPDRFRPTANGYRLVTRGTGIILYSSDGVIAAASSTARASVGSVNETR